MQTKIIVLGACLSAGGTGLLAQTDFHIAGADRQMHAFVSQGFAASDDNNYLTRPHP